MSTDNTENPIHAPLPPLARPHRNTGDDKRVRLANGPMVEPATLAQLAEWKGRQEGMSYGILIDRLVILSIDAGYDPVTRSYHKQTKSQRPGLPKPSTNATP